MAATDHTAAARKAERQAHPQEPHQDNGDPTLPDDPVPASPSFAARARTACLVIVALSAAGFALYYLGPIIKPFLVAAFVFILVKPAADRLRRLKVPMWAASLAFLAILTAVLALIGRFGYEEFAQLEHDIPDLRGRAEGLIRTAYQAVGASQAEPAQGGALVAQATGQQTAETNLFKPVFDTSMGFVEFVLMWAFYLIFMFLEADKLPDRVRKAFPEERAERYLTIGDDISRSVHRYLVAKTYINLGLAATTGVICLAFGVKFWLLWALLMFLANYITYIGSIAALLPPIAFALLTFANPWLAGGLAVVLVLNRLVWIDYLEMRFLGGRLNISPLILLLGIAFFGLLWGVAGMFLAVPLLTMGKIVMAHFEGTRPAAILLSEE